MLVSFLCDQGQVDAASIARFKLDCITETGKSESLRYDGGIHIMFAMKNFNGAPERNPNVEFREVITRFLHFHTDDDT